ncbi:LSM domain eukaryotic/archaea-type [Trinorchestia longiramus]|nr:LSM domain eukaryotic/archaea-type [Trinorchestia longiramus]
MEPTDSKARHRIYNTLTCVVHGLVGRETTVELHNDSYVTGIISNADGKMNIEMVNAQLTDGNDHSIRLSKFYVMGRKVRYVHIPEDVDVLRLIESQVGTPGSMRGRGRGRARGRGRGRGQSVREKIAVKREQQTLRRFQREKQEQLQQQRGSQAESQQQES